MSELQRLLINVLQVVYKHKKDHTQRLLFVIKYVLSLKKKIKKNVDEFIYVYEGRKTDSW